MKLVKTFLLTMYILISIPSYSDFVKVKVFRIVDGDTLTVLFKGKQDKVRLIGIDTPESRYNYKTARDSKRSGQDIKTIIALGKLATKYVKTLVKKGDRVKLEFDVQERDRFGRLLAYVYLADGRMLNDLIIRNGYAVPMTIAPSVRYTEKFWNLIDMQERTSWDCGVNNYGKRAYERKYN